MRVRTLRGPEAFDELTEPWQALSAAVGVERHAQLEEWARAACRSGSPDQVWFSAEDDDGPLAVLHGEVSRRRRGGVAVRVLRNGLADGLLAPRGQSPDRRADLRAELFRALARDGQPADVLSLNRLREGAVFHRLAQVTPELLREEPRFGGYSVVDTTVGADEWFAAAGKNLRGSLRKARNRAARAGEVRTVAARAPDEVAAGFEQYVRLEAAGWKGAAGALVNRPAEHQLLRETLAAAAEAGRARVGSLWVGDELAASQLGVLAGPSLVLLKVAYNEGLSALAPGNLLMEDLVRECCEDPAIRRIDLVTNQEWHARWHPTTCPTFQMQAFNTRRLGGLVGRAAALVTDRR